MADPLLEELLRRRAWTGPGNINLFTQPIIKNPDGSTSTVNSMGFGEDGKEVLVPTTETHGRGPLLSGREAIDQYRATGKHLGKFSSIPEAEWYAEQLHNDYAEGKLTPPMTRGGVDPDKLEKVLMHLLSGAANKKGWFE